MPVLPVGVFVCRRPAGAQGSRVGGPAKGAGRGLGVAPAPEQCRGPGLPAGPCCRMCRCAVGRGALCEEPVGLSGLPPGLHPPSPPSLPTPPTPSLPCSRVPRHCPYRATPAVRRGHGPALRPDHRRRPHLAAGAALQGAPRLPLPRISGLCCCCADLRHYHFYKLLCQPTSLLERSSTVQLFAVSARSQLTAAAHPFLACLPPQTVQRSERELAASDSKFFPLDGINLHYKRRTPQSLASSPTSSPTSSQPPAAVVHCLHGFGASFYRQASAAPAANVLLLACAFCPVLPTAILC